MKEIKILQQELRSYPSNWFVYCDTSKVRKCSDLEDKHMDVLVICDVNREEKGIIELGPSQGKK